MGASAAGHSEVNDESGRVILPEEVDDIFPGWTMLAALVIVTLVLLGGVYAFLGWNRAETVCSTDAAVPPGASGESVSYSWSWSPPGVTCTWGEITVTKLWW